MSTAESGKITFQEILKLRQQIDRKIIKLGRRGENARILIMHLYKKPMITVQKTMELLDIKYEPANKLISLLVEMKLLKEITGFQRNRIFLMEPYIDIFLTENKI